MKISLGLKQAYDVQNFSHEAIMALRSSLADENGKLKVTREDASAVYQLVRSWQAAQERISFHRRVPRPGVLRPEKRKSLSKPPSVAPMEPMDLAGSAA